MFRQPFLPGEAGCRCTGMAGSVQPDLLTGPDAEAFRDTDVRTSGTSGHTGHSGVRKIHRTDTRKETVNRKREQGKKKGKKK